MTQPANMGKDADGYRITFNRLLQHPVSKVWDALVNPKKLALWFMKTELDPVPGGRMTMHFGDAADTVSYGRIVRIEPEKYLEYVWENEDGPDELAVWELFPEENSQCRLHFTYSRLAEGYAVSVSAGWHQMLDLLADVLDQKTAPAVQVHDGQATEEGKMLQKHYATIWNTRFRDFELSKQYGTFIASGDRYDIRFERTFAHPSPRVWLAITDPEIMEQWLGGPCEMDLRPGGQVKIGLLMTTVTGRITQLIPGKLIEYTFGEAGNRLRWEVLPEGEQQCKLTFTETAVDRSHLEGATPGWHGYLDFLSFVLEGKPRPSFPLEAWDVLSAEIGTVYNSEISKL